MRSLLTPQQTADRLLCHVQTVHRYIRERRLESFQLVPRGKRYITEASIDALIEEKIEEAARRG